MPQCATSIVANCGHSIKRSKYGPGCESKVQILIAKSTSFGKPLSNDLTILRYSGPLFSYKSLNKINIKNNN